MPKQFPVSYYRRAEELYLQMKMEGRSVYWIWKSLVDEGKRVNIKTVQRWVDRWRNLEKFE